MNNSPINTGISEAPLAPKIPVQKTTFLSPYIDKLPPGVKDMFGKFYANKKIFWPVTIVFGLLFLVIIAGLLFGNRGGTTMPVLTKKPTPSPFVQATPAPCASSDALCATSNQLIDLENQITNLDLNQSRLAPPKINYDISF